MANRVEIEILTDIRDATRDLRDLQKKSKQSLEGVSKEVRKAQGAFGGFTSVLKTAAGSFLGLLSAIGAQRVISGVTNQISETITGVARLGDEAIKTADKLGVNVEALQELRFAAERSGISTSQFDVALQRFTRRAAEAAQGTGEAKGALQELGVELRDANGNLRPAEELLGEVATGFQNTASQADRVRLAFKLFDTEGVQLVNLLQQGGEEVDKLRAEFRKLGGVISEDAARSAEEFTDAQTNLNVAIQGARNRIGGELLPIFTELTKAFTNTIVNNKALISSLSNLIKDGILRLIGLIPTTISLFANLLPVIKALINFFEILTFTIKQAVSVFDFEASLKGVKSFVASFKKDFDNLSGSIVESSVSTDSQRFELEKLSKQIREVVSETNTQITANSKLSKTEKQITEDVKKRTAEQRKLNAELAKQAQAGNAAAGIAAVIGGQALDFNQQAGTVIGTVNAALKGAQGAAQLVSSIIGNVVNTLLPGIGGVVTEIFQVLAQGPEKVREMITGFVEALPDILANIIIAIQEIPIILIESADKFIDRIIANIPRIIRAQIEQTPRIILALAKEAPKIITAIIEDIPNLIKELIEEMPKVAAGFLEALVAAAPQFVEALIKAIPNSIGGAAAGFAGFGPGGALGGGIIGDLFGFQEGGRVPNVAQFENDKFLARLSAGEQVLDKDLTNSLERFLREEGTGGRDQSLQLNIQIGEKELADVLLNLNRQGFRTS